MIHFDVDDVLLDWLGGFRSFLKVNHGIETDPDGPGTWSLDAWVGRPAAALVRQFNSSVHFERLEPTQGAIDLIKSLQGRTLRVITSCNVDGSFQIKEARQRNLLGVFGNAFKHVHILDLGQSKRKVLEEIPKGVWVEDNYFHAIDGANAGHETYLLRTSHNRGLAAHPKIKRVDSLSELVSHLT
jgi:FMN phosphatase YigB (HAD superfamily)